MTGDTKVQTDKFKAAARELGCDDSEERFEAALGKIVKHKPVEPLAKAKREDRESVSPKGGLSPQEE
ncbi:hypothetical protein [Bosea sp. 685]|uniref:hypothetical protein n=1 Tax=Bosea sp. 685 TaxID=3080057 RepID=UPI0028936684|nr:hypothetical protein [Bosea sp. 685]WNJ89626.1 hypothetical protein RMR04_24985 [Bosea sp. 685]